MTPSPLLIASLAVAYGWLFQLLFYGQSPGVNWLMAIALLLGGAWWIGPRGSRVDRLDLWIAPAALALSAGVALRADPTILVFNIPAAAPPHAFRRAAHVRSSSAGM